MPKSSEQIIHDIQTAKTRRLQVTVRFLVVISIFLLVMGVWVKADTNRLINDIKNQNIATEQRAKLRNDQLTRVGEQLKVLANDNKKINQDNRKLLLCLLSIHDPTNFGHLTNDIDCQKQVNDISHEATPTATLQPPSKQKQTSGGGAKEKPEEPQQPVDDRNIIERVIDFINPF